MTGSHSSADSDEVSVSPNDDYDMYVGYQGVPLFHILVILGTGPNNAENVVHSHSLRHIE